VGTGLRLVCRRRGFNSIFGRPLRALNQAPPRPSLLPLSAIIRPPQDLSLGPRKARKFVEGSRAQKSGGSAASPGLSA